MGEKVSSGIWETCPKILGGYEYQNPPEMGDNIYIYIYNYNYLYHIIIVIKSQKIYRKSKNFHEENVLRIQFYICCANFITISELPVVLYIYIYI